MQPNYPQYPQYPQQTVPAYPQQYAPAPMAPQYAPPPSYYPPQPPAQPAVAGTLDDFFDQPSTGSKSWQFKDHPIGTRYAGIVARAIGKGDIRQQTDQQGQPLRFRDGRPKFVMVVPMIVAPSPEFPEGQASWWVKGQARDELVRAMAEAGAPAGPPEAGAGISVTLVGMRPIPGFNPAFQYRIIYRRPTGANMLPTQAPWNEPAPQPVRPGAGAYEPPPMPYPQGPYAPAPTDPPTTLAMGPPPVVQPPAAPAAPPPDYAAAPPAMAPNSLTAEQQALLAQLTGG